MLPIALLSKKILTSRLTIMHTKDFASFKGLSKCLRPSRASTQVLGLRDEVSMMMLMTPNNPDSWESWTATFPMLPVF